MKWFATEAANGATLDAPGIYVWVIDDKPVYAGKSVRLHHRLREYCRNVERLEAGLAYHIAGRAFRSVHHQLHDAKSRRCAVKAVVVENCEAPESLMLRERYWINRVLSGRPDLRQDDLG